MVGNPEESWHGRNLSLNCCITEVSIHLSCNHVEMLKPSEGIFVSIRGVQKFVWATLLDKQVASRRGSLRVADYQLLLRWDDLGSITGSSIWASCSRSNRTSNHVGICGQRISFCSPCSRCCSRDAIVQLQRQASLALLVHQACPLPLWSQ
jgi:hypothetical protein